MVGQGRLYFTPGGFRIVVQMATGGRHWRAATNDFEHVDVDSMFLWRDTREEAQEDLDAYARRMGLREWSESLRRWR